LHQTPFIQKSPQNTKMSLMNAHITLLCDTPHNNTTGNYRY
jgi:hypothetical protein